MNAIEVQRAAQGSSIGNRPATEIAEIISTICERLGVPSRHAPKGANLQYIAQQVYHRHTYKLEELYLAVDYYNAGYLNFKIPEFQPFTVQTISQLMQSYRTEKARFIDHAPVQVEADDTPRKCEATRKQICNEIYEAMKRGERYDDRGISQLWWIAYQHLLDSGHVTAVNLTKAESAARQMMSAAVLRGDCAAIGKMIKIESTLQNYQAQVVVEEYMIQKMKP